MSNHTCAVLICITHVTCCTASVNAEDDVENAETSLMKNSCIEEEAQNETIVSYICHADRHAVIC